MLEHLTQSVARQSVHKHHLSRLLVACEVSPTVVHVLLGAQSGIVAQPPVSGRSTPRPRSAGRACLARARRCVQRPRLANAPPSPAGQEGESGSGSLSQTRVAAGIESHKAFVSHLPGIDLAPPVGTWQCVPEARGEARPPPVATTQRAGPSAPEAEDVIQPGSEDAADGGTHDRDPRVSPIVVAFSGYRQHGVGYARAEIPRGVDGIAGRPA